MIRSIPISSIAPLSGPPKVSRIERSRSTAVRATMLPIVEPGKKPNRGWSVISAGKSTGFMKLASTGMTGKSGKRAANSSDELRRNSPLMSMGTYDAGSIAASRCGVLTELPEPNSTTQRPAPTCAPTSAQTRLSSSVSTRVG